MPLNQSDLEKIRNVVKDEIEPIKKDVSSIKETLNHVVDLCQRGFGSLLPWTDEIHKVIVKDKLPKRVKDLENIHPKGTHSPS